MIDAVPPRMSQSLHHLVGDEYVFRRLENKHMMAVVCAPLEHQQVLFFGHLLDTFLRRLH